MLWARAGHMPLLLARAGAADALDGPPGMLLGAQADTAHPTHALSLLPDDLVLFYTDGLVERRAAGPLALLDQVRTTLAGVSAQRLGAGAVARVRELLSVPSPTDDTCTLVVRVRV
jgi:serine phosphatase RsbU (regulator of sigma subunit)